MNKKKVTFAIVLFIILGLFVYAFANPLNDDEMQPEQNNNGEQRNPSSDNSGEGLISDISNNNNNSVNPRRQRRNITRNLNNTNTVINTTVSLVGDKSAAILELKQYRSEYVYSNDESYNKLIEDYTKKINDSTTIEDIVKNLNDGRDAIDNLIKNDLDAYKESAKKEVKEYAETKDVVSSYEELLKEFNTNVDQAKTKDEIDTLVKEAKEALDELERKDIEDAKTKAIEELNNYKVEETNDITEVKESKDETREAITNAQSIEEVTNILTEGKKAIDEKIANKRYKVTFVGKAGKTVEYIVPYKGSVEHAPTNELREATYRNVTYKLKRWDKANTAYKNVKSDVTINGVYDITKVVASVYLLKDDIEIPEDKTVSINAGYTYLKKIELDITDEIKKAIDDDKYAVVLSSDEDIRKVDKNKELPTKDGKYKEYEFYVMKFCESSAPGFHIDGKLKYDREREFLDKKNEALDDIKEYKSTDEEYIEEISTIKKDFEDNLKNINNIDELNESVENTKKAIDEAISKKEFTVTFIGIKGKELSKQVVGYKKSANIPEMKKNITEWSGSISLEFLGWDAEEKDLKSVKENLVVHTKYKVLKATTKISILKEDGIANNDTKNYYHPYNKPDAPKDTYFDLKVTKKIENAVNNYSKDPIYVYETHEQITYVLEGEPTLFNNNKYKKLEYYVLKLQGDRFHCDAKIIYDKEQEKLDNKKEELNKLIEAKEKLDTAEKTKESVDALNKAIKTAKENVSSNDINKINESIDTLNNIKLVDIKITALYVKNNKDIYYDYEDKLDLTVTFDDNDNHVAAVTTDYKVDKFNKTPGKHTAKITYKDGTATIEYTVKANVIESLTVVNNRKEYYIKEPLNIVVSAQYTDGKTKELTRSEYDITGFDTKKTTHYTKRFKDHTGYNKATVSAGNKSATFEYAVSRDDVFSAIDIDFDYSERKLSFKNVISSVSIKSMKKTYLFDSDYNIALTASNEKNVFYVDEKSAGKIQRTNTIPSGQTLVVTYVLDGKEYEVVYAEVFDYIVK